MARKWHLAIYIFFGLRLLAALAVCIDQDTLCGFWAGIDECPLNPIYMLCMCSQSCVTNSECPGGLNADTQCTCGFDAARGLCEHGTIMATCPYTCSLRQTIICDHPPSFPNAVATGTRRYLDRVTYKCRHGYRNVGNIGLRVCLANGNWKISNDQDGQSPNCVADPSMVIPCSDLKYTFESVSRTSVDQVGIFDSKQGYSVAECLTWCQREPGCTHAAYVNDNCVLYYHIAGNGFTIVDGDVWERKTFIEPVFYYA